MRVLLVTPPMVQFNTPYPAMPALAAFLRARGHTVAQEDLSLALALELFHAPGVRRVLAALRRRFPAPRRAPPSVRHALRHAADLPHAAALAVRFLQGRAPEWTEALAARDLLPEGPRFDALDAEAAELDAPELARLAASLFIDDLADAVREGLDPRFELARYGERLAADVPSFDPLAAALRGRPTLPDRRLDALAAAALRRHRPQAVGLTVPFPGTVYGAFRIARQIRRLAPRVRTVLGGGYVNTELRELSDPRVFDYFDYLVFDDGERPLQLLLEHLEGRRTVRSLKRTWYRRDGEIVRCDAGRAPDVRHRERPAPALEGIERAGYLAMAETPNPMHRLWTERRWNKLQLAHGCYWHRCAFCDTSLDYVRRFDPADAGTVVRWIEAAIAATGERGFHFVDEAAPPTLLRALSEKLIERGLDITWWANIRFERHFTPALAEAMARSGCVAVTGGLEAANDRLLAKMDKGITLASAARVAHDLSAAGIMVHAYLMYGFPTQTVQETVDALEYVRQLFSAGCLQSAYWHRFALTVHSPMFQALDKFGIESSEPWKSSFARNEAPFREPGGADPARLGGGLRRALYNFMRGVGLQADVRGWFGHRVPRSRLPRDFVAKAI